MDILILGGTRYFGVHLAEALLSAGHTVTLATRGQAADAFGSRVRRLTIERTDAESLRTALEGRRFDTVYDNLAYSSNDIRALMEALRPSRYIMASSASVYPRLHLNTKEEEFNPLTHPLRWCGREDFPYDEIKRQAECALFQAYPDVPGIAVRFPYVIGPDDYTKRLYFYVEHTLRGTPMHIDNLDAQMGFIHAREAGSFLAWMVSSDFTGPLNACCRDTASLGDILTHVARATGREPILSPDGEPGPYNGGERYSLSCRQAGRIGYTFSSLHSWLPALLDTLIAQASAAGAAP